jgi:transcriptional regulator with XRE-family HTH domain
MNTNEKRASVRRLQNIDPQKRLAISRRMQLAAYLDECRVAKGWSQKDLAEALGKHPSEISKWLSGTHNFNMETLWLLGDALGVDLVTMSPPERRTGKMVLLMNKTIDKHSEMTLSECSISN